MLAKFVNERLGDDLAERFADFEHDVVMTIREIADITDMDEDELDVFLDILTDEHRNMILTMLRNKMTIDDAALALLNNKTLKRKLKEYFN